MQSDRIKPSNIILLPDTGKEQFAEERLEQEHRQPSDHHGIKATYSRLHQVLRDRHHNHRLHSQVGGGLRSHEVRHSRQEVDRQGLLQPGVREGGDDHVMQGHRTAAGNIVSLPDTGKERDTEERLEQEHRQSRNHHGIKATDSRLHQVLRAASPRLMRWPSSWPALPSTPLCRQT